MSKGNNLQSLFCGILFCISITALIIACLAFTKGKGGGEYYKETPVPLPIQTTCTSGAWQNERPPFPPQGSCPLDAPTPSLSTTFSTDGACHALVSGDNTLWGFYKAKLEGKTLSIEKFGNRDSKCAGSFTTSNYIVPSCTWIPEDGAGGRFARGYNGVYCVMPPSSPPRKPAVSATAAPWEP